MPQLMDIFAKWIGEGTSELERDTLEDKLEAENYQPK